MPHRTLVALTALALLTAGTVPTATLEAAEHRRGVKQVVSFLELRETNVTLQEYDISCGAAALATILRYQHGDMVSEREVARAMLGHTDSELVRARLGFSLLDLKNYAEDRGYVAEGYGGLSLAVLISFGPAIVLSTQGESQ